MSEKNERRPVLSSTLVSLLFVWLLGALGCYQGVARGDDLSVIDVQTSSSKHVAMLIERSDHAALSGNTFFVILTDRVLTVAELRKRLYALDAVFVSDLGGVSLRWSSPDDLTIQCQKCEITRDSVEKQRFDSKGVKVAYVGFGW